MAPIVIIGSGLAGYNVAREFRKLDKNASLSIITADNGEFYSKPTLSNAFASKKTPDAIPIHSAVQMQAQLNAVVHTHTRVTEIAVNDRTLRTSGEVISYSKLVLAIGADQIRLPLVGNAADSVMSVNSLDDYARFRAAISGARRIVVIGAGLIGCEFANDLRSAGYEVDVVDIADQPLPRLLPPGASGLLTEKFAALGVNWHFGTGVTAVDCDGGRLRVTLENGEAVAADAVLSAVGLRPKPDLARAAGLKINRGIVVGRRLQTSAEDVFALGDCAEVAGLVLPFVMPIMHAARALASTLAGKPVAVSYPPMPVVVKTPACPTIVSPPPAGAVGQWKVESGADGVKSLFVDEAGKLLGFALSGTATAERARLAPQLPPVLAGDP